MKKPVIPIFYTADDHYAPYLSVSIISLLENANPDYRYEIYVVYDRMSLKTLTRLKTLKVLREKNARLHLKSMKEVLGFMEERPNTKLNASMFTLTIYYRIFIAQMFPQYEKGIYIDSDTVVTGDISELYNVNLGKKYLLGAVNDFSIKGNEVFVKYIEKVVGPKIDEYFNSGVLLINLAEMRKLHFDEHFLYLLVKYDFDTVAPDQDYLNSMCYGRVKLLPPEWDAMPAKGVLPMKNPKIVHYNLFFKPWHYDGVDYEGYFWRYAAESPFLREINAEKKAFFDDGSDMKHLGEMVERASKILKTKITFKNVFDSGEEVRAGKERDETFEVLDTGWGWKTVIRKTLKPVGVLTKPLTVPLKPVVKTVRNGAKKLKKLAK